MPSRQIDRFRSESQTVTTGAEEVAEVVAASLEERFRPFLQAGETNVDWVLAQKLIGRLLASKDEGLDGIDRQLELERKTNRKLRADRQQISAKLRSQLRAARLLIDESFGKGVAKGIFRQGKIADIPPTRLVRLGRETVEALRSPELQPNLLAAGADVGDPAILAAAIERRAEELAQHLAVLVPRRKRETLAVGAKQASWEEATSFRRRAQDMLFGLYRGAGFDHFASRLRVKRPSKAAAEQEGGKVTIEETNA